ncbi:hypothetical protein LY78DRAFT_663301 [Colletotrichum sublineola]|nr:hypothetical protein LY78DRAFT_663301 [Colletotrichum sublineola]
MRSRMCLMLLKLHRARCATYSAMVPREARFDRVEWTPTPKEFRASLSILRDDEYTLSRSRRSEQRGSHMEYRAPPRVTLSPQGKHPQVCR